MRALFVALLACVLFALVVPPARAQGPPVLVARIDSEITRATVEYVKAAIATAEAENARALVIRFDTPGGGLAETQEIQRMFLATRVPILGWVGPSGANAWSAGTILLESTDLAAMAPFTVIGSVQPVFIGGSGFEPVTEPKIINALVASLEETLRLHGRNETLAAEFIERNLNLNAEQALAARATELVAPSTQALLASAQGLVVQPKNITLDVAGAPVVTFNAPWGVAFFSVIANPIISGLLLLLGIYGIIFGISAPGHGAEIAGIIMVALGILGLGFSVSIVGVFLLILGIVLLVIEAKTPGFGVFGISGVLAIVLGTVFLAPVAPPRFLISRDAQLAIVAALAAPTAAFGGFLLFGMYKVFQVRRRKPVLGRLLGEEAEAVDPIPANGTGYVRYKGELWKATAAEDIAPGERVVITAKDGIVLEVRRGTSATTDAQPAERSPSFASKLRGIFRQSHRPQGPPPP